MAYEVFTRTVRRSGTPTITLGSNGRVGLTKASYEILHKQGVEWVLLLWDGAARKFALRASKKDPRAYRLHPHTRGGAGFSAVTFLEHIGYDFEKGSRQFPAEWNDEQGMFEVTLPEEQAETKPLLAVMNGSRKTRPNAKTGGAR